MLSPFSSIRDMAKQALSIATLGLGGFLGTLVAEMFVSKEAIRLVSCPTLLLHGAVDQAITSRHSQVLFKACGSTDKALHILEGMHHDNCFQEPHFYEILVHLQRLVDRPARGGAQELQISPGARYEQGCRYPAGRCDKGVRYSALLRAMAVEMSSHSRSMSAASGEASSSPSRAWSSREIPKCSGELPMCSRGWGHPVPRGTKPNPRWRQLACAHRSTSPSTSPSRHGIASFAGALAEAGPSPEQCTYHVPSHERGSGAHSRGPCMPSYSSKTPPSSYGASLSPGVGCKLSPAQRIKAHRDEQKWQAQSPHLHVSTA